MGLGVRILVPMVPAKVSTEEIFVWWGGRPNGPDNEIYKMP